MLSIKSRQIFYEKKNSKQKNYITPICRTLHGLTSRSPMRCRQDDYRIFSILKPWNVSNTFSKLTKWIWLSFSLFVWLHNILSRFQCRLVFFIFYDNLKCYYYISLTLILNTNKLTIQHCEIWVFISIYSTYM